jgi:hypothetical protein
MTTNLALTYMYHSFKVHLYLIPIFYTNGRGRGHSMTLNIWGDKLNILKKMMCNKIWVTIMNV